MNDTSRFPDPTYATTVLAPLFDGAKLHHAEGFQRIDRAHLVMLAATGILSAAEARRIAGALTAIDAEIDPAALTYTGEHEDYFFVREAELKRRVGADLGGRLHTGRSRNDMDHTLFKLSLKAELDLLQKRLRALIAAVLTTARRERDTIILAYTHGQPAQPSTYGHYLCAMAEVLLRDAERQAAARTIVDLCPMGAAAITTSGFPLDRPLMAELLGFAAPLENSYGCIASVDYVTATYSAIELLFLHLGRPIQDLQVWTSFEVGQLYVPNAFVQISSIMPQKRNPVPIEHMRHLSSQTAARAHAMLTIMHNTPFTDMNDSEGESQGFGAGAFASGGRVLELLAAMLPTLQVQPERVRENIRRSCATITELADTLVRSEALSFRQAHEIAADVARHVVAAGGAIETEGYAPFREAFGQMTGRSPAMDATAFARAVSPEQFVAVRGRLGGPAPAALDAALTGYEAKLAKLEQTATDAARHEQASARMLARRFAALADAA